MVWWLTGTISGLSGRPSHPSRTLHFISDSLRGQSIQTTTPILRQGLKPREGTLWSASEKEDEATQLLQTLPQPYLCLLSSHPLGGRRSSLNNLGGSGQHWVLAGDHSVIGWPCQTAGPGALSLCPSVWSHECHTLALGAGPGRRRMSGCMQSGSSSEVRDFVGGGAWGYLGHGQLSRELGN